MAYIKPMHPFIKGQHPFITGHVGFGFSITGVPLIKSNRGQCVSLLKSMFMLKESCLATKEIKERGRKRNKGETSSEKKTER